MKKCKVIVSTSFTEEGTLNEHDEAVFNNLGAEAYKGMITANIIKALEEIGENVDILKLQVDLFVEEE